MTTQVTGDRKRSPERGRAPSSRLETASERLLARLPPIVRAVVVDARRDRINGVAAEVAFFGILAVFPGLLMVAAALGVLDVFIGSDLAKMTRANVIQFLNFILTERARPAVVAVADLFEAERGGVLTLASLAALWALRRGFSAIVVALDVAYDVKETRSWHRRLVTELGLAVGSVVLLAIILTAFVAGPFFGNGESLASGLQVLGSVWSWARWPVTMIALVLWATILFHFAPNHHSPWRWDLPGGAIAATLWLACSGGLTLYLRFATAGNPVIGALGGGLILLIWLYLLSLGLLLGGEVNAASARGRIAARETASTPRASEA